MSWYDAFKDVLSIAQKADNLELYRQLLELQKELQEMQQENFELKKENAQLKEQLDKTTKMVYVRDKNYYIEKADDSTEDGPFCPRCWDKDRNQARLGKFRYDLKCNVCGLVVGDENIRRDQERLKNYEFNL